jgi:hypothetical protein
VARRRAVAVAVEVADEEMPALEKAEVASDSSNDRKRTVSKKMKDTFLAMEGGSEESLKSAMKVYKAADQAQIDAWGGKWDAFARAFLAGECTPVKAKAPAKAKADAPKKAAAPKAAKNFTWTPSAKKLFAEVVEGNGGAVTDDLKSEFVAHVTGAGGAWPAEPVCGRGRHGATECVQQRERQRMVGHAHGHGVAAAGDGIRHGCGARHHQGERPRPECIGQRLSAGSDLRDQWRQIVSRRDVADERMVGGASLCRENATDGDWVERIPTEAVDGLGGKCHEPAGHEGTRPHGHRVGHDAGQSGDVPMVHTCLVAATMPALVARSTCTPVCVSNTTVPVASVVPVAAPYVTVAPAAAVRTPLVVTCWIVVAN